ncbi:hypothetical protein CONLIGDRAFT_670854 [Coniochaeta ligniaria NRRL 30616]|uniref:DUF1996 domain-containing protein n=1 Tax=Coniochaeta ligniaria NRRL 30616 TaxID=1408157 RepID=A0A1J7INK5_9PEZI|nr:hypothetical protein CONLIGDRAFT_670854 [Coniochaeta ligniaria NRRL 30616]
MNLPFSRLVHLTLVLGLASQTTAFWVLGCGKPVAVERLDPIVSPGTVSTHAHTVMGGNAFDWDLDFNKTQTSNCTTCGVSKDLSNYRNSRNACFFVRALIRRLCAHKTAPKTYFGS